MTSLSTRHSLYLKQLHNNFKIAIPEYRNTFMVKKKNLCSYFVYCFSNKKEVYYSLSFILHLFIILQQRSFQSNNYWQELLTHILRSQKANTSSTMTSPNNHILRWVSAIGLVFHFSIITHNNLIACKLHNNAVDDLH